jgi:transcriptional regulator with XRE-family HTH domain
VHGIALENGPMTDDGPSGFAAKLKELREAAGLTQGALAERAGMHKLGVAKLEQGLREPKWASVQALARALGVGCSAFEGTMTGPAAKVKGRGRPRMAVEANAPAAKPTQRKVK